MPKKKTILTLLVLSSLFILFAFMWAPAAFGYSDHRVNLAANHAKPPTQLQASSQLSLLDSDFDGIPDNVEQTGWYNGSGGPYHTESLDADSDKDGLTDGQEQLFDTNPLDDTNPGIYIEYSDGFKTSKYFPWQKHGDKYVAFDAVVVRRGTTFYVGGPASATIRIDKSIDALTSLTASSQLCGIGRWKIDAPAAASSYGGTNGGTVGKYKVTLSKGSWSRSLDLYVIFELPPNMSNEDRAAFVYSDDPNNTRDEYSVHYLTSDTLWPDYDGYHKSNGRGFIFQTDQYQAYVFRDHIIDQINGKTRQADAATALANHVDWYFQFNNLSIRYNMQDALRNGSHRGTCGTHANVLTSFARGAGIPARPAGTDWDAKIIVTDDFDFSTELWITNDWQVMRAYKNLNEQPFPNAVGGIRPLTNRRNWIYGQTYSDMIISGNSNWNIAHMNRSVSEPQTAWDYQIGNWYKQEMVRWDWVATLAKAYWGWSKEPNDIGDPTSNIPWPCCTPTPTPTNTPTPTPTPVGGAPLTLASIGSQEVGGGQVAPTPTSTATSTPYSETTLTANDGSLFKPITPVAQNSAAGAILPVGQNGGQGKAAQLGQVLKDYGLDLNGNGRFDQLVIEVEVKVSQPGYYNVNGLIDSDKLEIHVGLNGIALATNYSYLVAGTQIVKLIFDSGDIEQAGVDGPYGLKHLWLSTLAPDSDSMQLIDRNNWLDEQESVYVTSAYRVGDFESLLGAKLSDSYSHQVKDSNGDGYFDNLTVSTKLNITRSGTYRVEAELVDSQGEVVGMTSWSGSDGQVVLQFERVLGDVRPYFLNNVRLYDMNGGLLDVAQGSPGIYTIGSLYNLGLSTQSVVTPTVISVTTPDNDNDGDYDSLDFHINVTLGVAGSYRLEGWLESNNGALLAWQTSDPVPLGVGLQTLTLSYPGQIINDFKVNGPYKLVALKVLFGNSGYQVIDEIDVAYQTSAYSFDDFNGASNDSFGLIDRGEASNWNQSATNWGLTSTGYRSPLYSWTDSPNTNYSPGSTKLTSNPISISNGAAPVISFQTCYNINTDGDQGKLQLRTGSSDWATINGATYTGATNGWFYKILSSPPVIGVNSVEFRFLMEANASGNAEGWYIDDAAISFDYDLDNDGIGNGDEFGSIPGNPIDTDNDGIPDYNDIDSDNDTIPDATEGNTDLDGDGIPNYRDIDSDGDGSPDNVDPVAYPDSDGDGMPDGWEEANGFNPQISDGSGDADGDGLSNVDEYWHRTDPHNPDTDNDRMSDGWEVANGFDPLVNDAEGDVDGDGLSNIEEFIQGTDPGDSDTDGDGLLDGVDPEPGRAVRRNFLPLIIKK